MKELYIVCTGKQVCKLDVKFVGASATDDEDGGDDVSNSSDHISYPFNSCPLSQANSFHHLKWQRACLLKVIALAITPSFSFPYLVFLE